MTSQEQPQALTTQVDVFYLFSVDGMPTVKGRIGGGLLSVVLGTMVGLVLVCVAGVGLYIVAGQIQDLVPGLNGAVVADGQTMQVVSKEQRGGNYYVLGNVEAKVNGQKQTSPVEMEVDRITFENATTGQVTRIQLRGTSVLGRVFSGTSSVVQLACGVGLVLFALIFGFALFRYLFVQLPGETLRYSREGKALDGLIVEISGQALDKDPDPPYRVMLRYQFTTPQGKAIEAQASNLRKDLREKQLPVSGTPVKVQYVNDALYKVL